MLASALFHRLNLFLLLDSYLLQQPFLLRIVLLFVVIINKRQQSAVFAKLGHLEGHVLYITAKWIIKTLHRFEKPVKLEHAQKDVPEEKTVLDVVVSNLKYQLIEVPIELVSDVKSILLPEKAGQEA